MKRKIRLPFQNLNSRAWVNLSIAITLIFYLIQIAITLADFQVCGNIGLDYCAYWSAGKLINESSFASIYDLKLLKQVQMEVYPHAGNPAFEVFAVMYLPIFVLPFKFLSLINPPTSYIIWTFLNLVGLILYLRFFTREMLGIPISNRWLLILLLTLPVFVNFYEGQVNVWLVVGTGEFIRNIFKEKTFRAGLWLGGWLVKPQLLILVIPYLLFQRSFKAIKGFLLSAVLAVGISLVLIKPGGFIALFNIFIESGEGGVSSSPAIMINWRMVGWHITSLSSSAMGWALTIIGTLITIFYSLSFLRKDNVSNPTQTITGFLGIFAATLAVTWHAHLHMSMILIPPMAYLMLKNNINKKVFMAWVFFSIFIILLGIVIAIIASYVQLENLLQLSLHLLTLVRGFTGFLLNLLIIGWAILHTSDAREQILD